MFKEITLRNFLSFGPDSEPVTLGPLNVLLGANGSGKSNFIEAIMLLAATPRDRTLAEFIRGGGGVDQWIHKGAAPAEWLEVEAVVALSKRHANSPELPTVRHRIRVAENNHRMEVVDERVEDAAPASGRDEPTRYVAYHGGVVHLEYGGTVQDVPLAELTPDASIVSQVRGPGSISIPGRLGSDYAQIGVFREWTIGRNSSCRRPQPPDLVGDCLRGDGANLGHVLSELENHPAVRRRIEGFLQDLAPGFESYGVNIVGGSVQLFLREVGDRVIPASRLSDGTLRFLALLTVLLHPFPRPVVVIEEPELGIHPDLLPTIAKLLMEASARMQLIVTTHSDILVDALTPMPESVLFCDKTDGETVVRRATHAEIAASCGPDATDRMRLGQAWLAGDFGGRRW